MINTAASVATVRLPDGVKLARGQCGKFRFHCGGVGTHILYRATSWAAIHHRPTIDAVDQPVAIWSISRAGDLARLAR